VALWVLVSIQVMRASPAAAAIVLQDPANFRIARTFTVAPAVPRPIGGLRFTPDGTALYVVGAADLATSALYRMAVTRSAATQEVTALGSPVKVFDGSNPVPGETESGLDAGLEFGPGGTFFYTYFPTSLLGERPGGVTGTESRIDLPALVAVAGLTFAPARIDSGTSFGYLHVSTGLTSNLYEIPLVAGTQAGVWVPSPSSAIRLFARVFRAGPPRVGGDGVTGVQYVPAGTFAGDLLYASFVAKELWSVRIDDLTGLPVGGGSAPVEDLFASGFTAPPMGLEFDPLRPNELFVSTWDPDVNANNQILQIAGFASTVPTTLPTTTSTSTSSSTSSSTSTSTSRPPTTSTSSSSTSTSTSRPTTTSTSSSSSSSSTSSSTSTSGPTATSSSSSSSTSTSTTRAPTSTTGGSVTTTSRPTTSTTPAAVPIRTSSLSMRDRTGPPAAPTRRRFVFQSRTSGDATGVTVPARGSAGDPTGSGAALAVYNAAGSGELLVAVLPPSGWRAYGDGPVPGGYRWTAPSPDHPVARIVVRADRLRIRGGGSAWTYTLDEASQGAIAVALVLGSAPPWCTMAPAKSTGSPPSTAAYDHVDRFVAARNTPPPAVCPSP
jgi:hypothetical protein